METLTALDLWYYLRSCGDSLVSGQPGYLSLEEAIAKYGKPDYSICYEDDPKLLTVWSVPNPPQEEGNLIPYSNVKVQHSEDGCWIWYETTHNRFTSPQVIKL